MDNQKQTAEKSLNTLRSVIKENYPAWNGNRTSFLEDCDNIERALSPAKPDALPDIEAALKFISETHEFSNWNSITTPDWFVRLAALINSDDKQGREVEG